MKSESSGAIDEKYTVYLDAKGLLNLMGSLPIREHPMFEYWVTPSITAHLTGPYPIMSADGLRQEIRHGRLRMNPIDFSNSTNVPNAFGPYADVLSHALLRSAQYRMYWF